MAISTGIPARVSSSFGPIPEHMRICGVPIEPEQMITSLRALIVVLGPSADVANSAPVQVRSPLAEAGERVTLVQRVFRAMVRFGRALTEGVR